MRLMVTGAAGFVGMGLCKRLKERHEILPFDLKLSPTHDVTDYGSFLQYAKDARPDWLLHLAAQAFIPVGERDPLLDARVNVLGTLNALRVAKEVGCKLIYHSSGAVYGDQPEMPVGEDCVPNPQSFYGTSKLCGENYALHFAKHRGIEVWVTRFSSVVVEGRREGPVYYLCQSALKDGFITLTGDGSQSRDITHIDDVVQGIGLILSGRVPSGGVYNVASGRETTMRDLATRVFKFLGKEPDIRHAPPRPGDIGRNYYLVTKLGQYGYVPLRTLDDCIKLTFADL